VKERYAGWETPGAQALLSSDLETIAARVDEEGLDPEPLSGRQERLENWVNRFV
jgi:xylose isomerase